MSATRSASGPRPSPQAAYTRWMDACTAAGWRVGPAAERVPVRDGLGRVTGAPVRARWPAPRSACAAMDGIAIKAVPAAVGVWQLATGSFAWVDTGDLMPAGMDTVVERERVQFGADGSAQITGPAPHGLNVRATGEDFPAGELLIPAATACARPIWPLPPRPGTPRWRSPGGPSPRSSRPGMRSGRSGRRSGRAMSPTATPSCLPPGPGRPAPGPSSATCSPMTRTR
jgi:hypothetical protein